MEKIKLFKKDFATTTCIKMAVQMEGDEQKYFDIWTRILVGELNEEEFKNVLLSYAKKLDLFEVIE